MFKTKNLILYVLFSFVAFVPVAYVNADNSCDPEQAMSDWCSERGGQVSVEATNCHLNNAFLKQAWNFGMPGSMTQVVQCEGHLRGEVDVGDYSKPACSGTSEATCETVKTGYTGTGENRRAEGSLLSLANIIHSSIYDSPPPTNLAYFWNDSVKNIPFAGTALAAEIDYKNDLVAAVLGVWKISRNVALGMMSLILVIIGLLIIMQKKVDQQTVVNVQYALPKILISLFLIIFSYPIGAVLTSLGWALYYNAGSLVESLDMQIGEWGGSGGKLGSAVGGTAVLITVLAYAISTLGQWGSMGMVLLIAFVVIALMLAFSYVKAVLVYLKMVFSLISAPVEFAMATIPGNDAKIADWFKRMLVYVLTMGLMGATIHLTWRVALDVTIRYATTGTNLGGGLLTAAIPIVLIIYGIGVAIGMEKRVEAAIMGPPKKK